MQQIRHTATRPKYPCIDEMRRYRSFPCSECWAEECLFGRKPQKSIAVQLAPWEKECGVCRTPYRSYGKQKYCSDACRKRAVATQRKHRRARHGQFIY